MSMAVQQRPALTTEEIYFAAAAAGLRPDPPLTVSEWADKYRILPGSSSSEPMLWRTSRTPYLREIMDCLSESSPWERIVFLKSSQVGGTECGLNWLAWIIHQCPGPVLCVQPTTEMAKRLSKQRVDPMIAACPQLTGKVRDKRERDSSNTQLQKVFPPSGYLVLTGANSAVGLRSMPVRFLFLDEVDGYPSDVAGEGDPVELAIARTRTFPQRKIYAASSPTLREQSRIERLYDNSDQRIYEVPCPQCGHFQTLEFSQLRWPKGRPREAVYHCRSCDREIREGLKTSLLAAGRWRATADSSITAGFRISSLYSPLGWFSWGEACEQYERAGNNPHDLQVFHNTVLGQSYAESGETPDERRLYERRESYQIGVVPEGAGVLTAGADVQRDRIECEVVAWGPRRESWSVDYRVLHGDTSQPEVWKQLAALLSESFPCATGGTLQIERLAVDSGYNTMSVYNWARSMSQARVMVVHGENRATALVGGSKVTDVGPQGQRMKSGVRLWQINTVIAKEELYRNLRMDAPLDGEPFPPGWCHFPEYSLEYFEQLCAEKIMTKIRHGYPETYWMKIRARNEALDCRVYARAASVAARIDLWSDERWRQVLDDLRPVSVDERPAYHGISQTGLSPVPVFRPQTAGDPWLD